MILQERISFKVNPGAIQGLLEMCVPHKQVKKNLNCKLTNCRIHHLLKLQGIHQICGKGQEHIMHGNSISTIKIMFNSIFNIF